MPQRKPKRKIHRVKRRSLFILFAGIISAVVLYLFILFPGGYSISFPVHSAPRKANYYLAWDISSAKVAELAKWDLLILDMEIQINNPDALRQIRKLNPDIIILAYITPQEIRKDASTCLGVMRRKLVAGISEQWYLTDADNNRFTFWPGTWMLNIADNAPVVNGIRFNQYLANFVSKEIISSGFWDGVFYDNAWENLVWLTGHNADLDKDGISDAGPDEHWQNGTRSLYSMTRNLTGGKYIIVGNGANEAYKDDLNGVMLENFPPLAWKESMRLYDRNQDGTIEPRINIINANTANKGSKDNFRKMRFGLASALLLDGYYSFDYGDKDHSQTWWYDEYGVQMGDAAGNAASMNNTPKYGDDVWKREYDHGIAIVNPTQQSQNVDLGGEYEKIIGQQDPKVNDGSIVSQVTLGAKDGLLMLKTFQSVKNLVFANGNFLRFFDISGNRARNGFFAYEEGLPGGAKIFHGDLDGDGQEEKIVAAGPRLRIFNSRGDIWYNDFPLGGNYSGELRIAVGKLVGSSQDSLVVSGSMGGKVLLYTYYGAIVKDDVYPLGKKYKAGFSVAIGNVDGGQEGEIILGTGKGRQAQVIIYDNGFNKVKKQFFVESKDFKGGITVAAGNISGGADKIIVGLNNNKKELIRVFDFIGKKVSEFSVTSAFGSMQIDVGALDVNFDGKDEIVLMNT